MRSVCGADVWDCVNKDLVDADDALCVCSKNVGVGSCQQGVREE
jgi:hypothetical protein